MAGKQTGEEREQEFGVHDILIWSRGQKSTDAMRMERPTQIRTLKYFLRLA